MAMPHPQDVMTKRPVLAGEVRSIAVLALGFGLVGIDRFLIATLYPNIALELHLDYADIGTITGALALAWGGSALVMGNISDRLGLRRVLVGALVAFSLLIGGSGLASGLVGLVLVRIVMGFADGAFAPASIAAIVQASPPQRHGMNVGLQQATMVLFGLGLSPLLVGFLLQSGVNWHVIFVLFAPPGLLLAFATAKIIPAARRPRVSARSRPLDDWRAVIVCRNIPLLMAGMFCWLTCLVTMSAFLPSYLIDHFALNTLRMSVVLSAMGFGSVVGTIALSALSDVVGRKPVMLLSAAGALCGILYLLLLTVPDTARLFAGVFVVNFFNNALITLTVGPLSTESVAPELMATASGLVIAAGELLGGGGAPILGGIVAARFGIAHILWFPAIALAAGLLLCAFLEETHPGSVKKKELAT